MTKPYYKEQQDRVREWRRRGFVTVSPMAVGRAL